MEEASSSRTATRRALLRRGLTIGLTAPVLIAALQTSTAQADDDDQEDRDDRRARPRQLGRAEAFTSDLITVSQAASSGDFSSGNAGSDPLTDGQVRLQRRRASTNEGQVVVELRGAAPDAVYQVFFQPLNGSARQDLGTIAATNNDGNVNARTSSELGGTNRVGVFIIARSSDGSGQAGKDEFVSSLGG